MIDYTELKRLAKAATPGPWRHNKDNEQVGDVSNKAGYPFALVQQQTPMDVKQRDVDAAYIAAVLNFAPTMIAEIDRLRTQNQALREALNAQQIETVCECKNCMQARAALAEGGV